MSWVEKQIDAGVDCIWIDMFGKQTSMLYLLTKDFNHPAVKESYFAINEIIEKIREYGKKKGKKILVGSWPTVLRYYLFEKDFPFEPPKFDFITVSPSSKEVREMKFDKEKWEMGLKIIREKFGKIPIFAFIDWAGTTNTPLGQFSQVLSKEQQREFLKMADEFFKEKGVIFAYPVHGGYMGRDAKILSFGKSRVYDSLAPEFDTYETIKQLAQSKK